MPTAQPAPAADPAPSEPDRQSIHRQCRNAIRPGRVPARTTRRSATCNGTIWWRHSDHSPDGTWLFVTRASDGLTGWCSITATSFARAPPPRRTLNRLHSGNRYRAIASALYIREGLRLPRIARLDSSSGTMWLMSWNQIRTGAGSESAPSQGSVDRLVLGQVIFLADQHAF
ncbi:MAG: hypothetical protein MZV64_23175 [Ignavibacteriales bacterium]|nr:hypothetical protein [Ignavibacteriales bacterium]